jgi:hypothetical protein
MAGNSRDKNGHNNGNDVFGLKLALQRRGCLFSQHYRHQRASSFGRFSLGAAAAGGATYLVMDALSSFAWLVAISISLLSGIFIREPMSKRRWKSI